MRMLTFLHAYFTAACHIKKRMNLFDSLLIQRYLFIMIFTKALRLL